MWIWILAVIVLLVTALLFCPVTGWLAWEQGLTVQIRYLFFKIKLYPQKPKAEKKPKKQKKKDKKKTTEPPKDEKKEKLTAEVVGQLLSMVGTAIKSAKKPTILLLRRLKVKNVKLFVLVSGQDACETAIRYGQLNAAVYSALAAVKNVVTVRKTSIVIRPDFTECQEQASFQGEASLIPAFVLGAGILFTISFLKEMVKKKKNTKAQRETLEEKSPSLG